MKLDSTFEVVVKCYEFTDVRDLLNIEKYRTAPIEDITLVMDRVSASCFIFRNQKSKFITKNGFMVNIKHDPAHDMNGIVILDTNNNKVLYYVINMDEVFNTVVEGYIRLRTVDKISSLLELDFEDTRREDEEGLIDEFDIEEESK